MECRCDKTERIFVAIITGVARIKLRVIAWHTFYRTAATYTTAVTR
jgi:hypothetical protein